MQSLTGQLVVDTLRVLGGGVDALMEFHPLLLVLLLQFQDLVVLVEEGIFIYQICV